MSYPIAAIATGFSRTGIGVLRLSGDNCILLANRVFEAKCSLPLTDLPDRRLYLGTLFDRDRRPIDNCMVTVSHAPHSYTGEDTVEFQCHGSPVMLASALESLFAAGFRQAAPGEFTKRAFLNGQMDLTQAEAVIDLIDAETADAAANAAGQVAGAMRKKIDPLYDNLVDICSHFHAVIDYPDEDIDSFSMEQYASILHDTSCQLGAMLDSFERGKFIKNGLRAVILGAPNAGKSSFLNALAGFERVIVTDIPGTTRDSVEQSVTVGRHLLRLLDTAGIRETEDTIEKLGVARSVAAAEDCDLAIFVVDGSKPLTEDDQKAMDAAMDAPESICLLNKADLGCVIEPSDLPFVYVVPVSAKNAEGLDLFEQALDMILPEEDAVCDGSLLTNVRQYDAVQRAKDSIEISIKSMRRGMTPDAVLVDVEAAMEALGEVTGRTVREDITNRIFARFCVGK